MLIAHYYTHRTPNYLDWNPSAAGDTSLKGIIKCHSESDSGLTTQNCEAKSHLELTPLIQLSCTSEEFKRIKDLFTKTMHLETIRGIQRIQNQSLWETFQWQKEQMQKKNGGRNTEEKLLFHGTEKAYTETICNQNFDWRICGTHGTSYGKGSYFASDAIYSHQFSKQENGSRAMFVARVLVGEMVKGNESYVHPPLKEGMKTTYGSCVDNEDNPSIFVIFDKHQIYPEYLVEYDAASFLLI